MASMGSLVVDLQANTQQFTSAIARSQQAMAQFGAGANKAAEAAHALDVLTVGRDTVQQLQEAAVKMTDLQTATQMAAEQARRFEQLTHQASAATTVASTGLLALTKNAATVAKGTAVVSHQMHAVVIAAIALRRTLESLAWAFGVIADGIRVLLAPFRLLARSIGIVLMPFRVLGSAFMVFARAVGMVLGPIISLGSGVFMLWTYFKAFQLQIKLTQAILGMLPPKVKAVAAVLFGIGIAARTGQMALRLLGTAGRWVSAAFSMMLAPVRALLSPLKTLEAVAKKTASALKNFVSSAMTPLKLAFSGLGVVAAVGGMLKLAADAETLQMRMRVLTKDAAVAAKLVEDLNAFALTVPFDKMDIRSAATQLLAVQTPVGELIGDMQVLANLAAGSGQSITELTDIFATFRSQGTIAMQDVLQLQRRGINVVPELTAKFGDLSKAMENGRVTFYDIREALYAVATAGGAFAGMTDELSKGLAGQFAQLKNNILIAATAIGEQMRPMVTALLSELNGVIQAFMGIGDKVAFVKDLLVAAVDVATEAIKAKWQVMLGEMLSATAKVGGEIGQLLNPATAGAAASRLLGQMFGGVGANPRPAGLLEAEQRLGALIGQLKPKPAAPAAEPKLPPPPPGAGQKAAAGLGEFFANLKGDAAPVMAGLQQFLNDKVFGGVMAANKIAGLFGGGGERDTADMDKKTAGALQRGSADAYSAIVQAMMQRADPVVQATKDQTKVLKKPLFDLVDLIKNGPAVKLFGAFQE